MNKFFTHALGNGLIPDEAEVLDWIFSDDKFSGPWWDKSAKAQFADEIKKLFAKGEFRRRRKGHSYSEFEERFKLHRMPCALFASSDSMGKDFVKHIRNAIAHGQVDIEASDGYAIFRDKGGKGQASFIAIPLDYLIKIYGFYKEIEKDGKIGRLEKE